MTRNSRLLTAGVLVISGVISFSAFQPAMAEERKLKGDADLVELQVGRTAIQCYLEPCPWNGISLAQQITRPHSMLWSGNRLPPMRGSAEDQAYLRANYADRCTLVSGTYADGVLEVAEILGPC